MKYHNITKDDMLNGDGLRVVLWVSGCNHCCKDCQNPLTWDKDSGLVFDESTKEEIYTELDKSYISGLTLSGGDPLHPANIPEITEFVSEVRSKYPNKTVWLYTGGLWEDIYNLPVVKNLDVLVDGEFVVALKDVKLLWKGSSNQRVIDVQKTLCSATPDVPILHCEDYYV